MTRHLILGGCGFIGRHVALSLARREQHVTLADRAALIDPPEAFQRARVGFEFLDLVNADWDQLIADVDIIHHYAWSTIPQSANDDPIADLDINVRSTLRLLDAMRRRGGGRIVFASSGGTVYGRLIDTPASEDHPLDPITAYGVSKMAAEKYLGFYRALHGLDCRVARLSNPFGAGQAPNRMQGAASVFLHRAMQGETISIWGNGEVVRDYIHISDVASGLCALAAAERDHLADRWVFNISSGVGISLNDIVRTLGGVLGRPVDVEYLPGRAFDIPVSVLSPARAHASFGWSPRLTFDDGLRTAFSDQRNGPVVYSTIF